MTDPLRFEPGQFWQSASECISYVVGVGAVVSAPTSACISIFEGAIIRNASNLQAAGSAGPTISTCYVTTPCIVALRAGINYRVWIKYEKSGEVFQNYFDLRGV